MHILGREQVHNLAVLELGSHAHMGMLAAACYPRNGLSLEGNLEAVHAEYFLHDNTRQDFVISSLYASCELPVHLQLLHNVRHVTSAIDLTFNAAAFLMAHFRLQAVIVKGFHGLLQSSAHVAAGALPILLLHHLGGAQSLNGCILTRGFYPKFQLSSTGKYQFINIIAIDMLKAGNHRMLFKELHDFAFNIVKSIL